MITVTENAQNKLRELMNAEAEAGMSLRVEVKPGGCSGYRYEMSFDSETGADDLKLELDGLTVISDPQSAELLKEARLDYTDGLNGAGFKIENPGAKRTCGCGQSFN